MAVKPPHYFDTGIYFITFTNFKWIPLFRITNSYNLVYKWFDSLKANGHSILGYVIMPNHVHVLVGYISCKNSINTVVGNGKRFMAYDIVSRVQQMEDAGLQSVLGEGVLQSDRNKGQKHVVFEDSSDIKLCQTYTFIQQKLDYIHSNPINKKWSLVANMTDYVHSSARFYELGRPWYYEPQHVNDWIHLNGR